MVDIGVADADEAALFGQWAQSEGWQPGIDDVAAFRAADPDGFLVARDGGDVVGTVSLVRYDDTYAFLGFFIVRPDRRGEGIGESLWDAAIARAGQRVVGLDGVAAQVHRYERGGFVFAQWTPRFSGPPAAILEAVPESAGVTVEVAERGDALTEGLLAFDSARVPAPRPAFLASWLAPGSPRIALVARRGAELVGYAVVRPTLPDGARIGPLFARDDAAARALLRACAEQASAWPGDVAIDVPETNAAATLLAEQAGLTAGFKCARMYRGGMPPLPLDEVYGSTTYELG